MPVILGYPVSPAPPTASAKAPGDVLDYLLDFTKEFGVGGGSPGDTLASISNIAASPPGLQVASGSIVSGGLAILFWAASGQAGQTYTVTATASTTDGRVYVREGMIPVGPV